MTLVDRTTQSIRANTLSRSEREFWQGPGQGYWEANLRAMRRKVRVERVFVYAEPDAEFDRVSALQAASGVEVYRVDEDLLQPDLVEHILILDELWSQEIKLSPDDTPEDYLYRVNPTGIAAAARAFERIQAQATRLLEDDAIAELKAAGIEPPARAVPT